MHGPLKELDPTAGFDKASLIYTRLRVPAEVTIRESVIPGAGLGVFTTQFIPRGVQVGPYEGRRVELEEIGDLKNISYLWEVSSVIIESIFMVSIRLLLSTNDFDYIH